MIYYAQIKGLDDKDYKVTITTQVGSGSTEITLAGNEPIVIDQVSDGFFAPVKSRSATIKILSGDFYFDIYTAEAQGVEVRIVNLTDDILIFRGYVTPNIYDQNYKYLSEIEVEAIEALSTLDYFGYEYNNATSADTVSVYTILKNLLYGKCGYQYMAFTKEYGDILNSLKLNEKNFLSDDGEYVQDASGNTIYNGEPWTCKEVLEEICKYLNISATINNDTVCFLSYPNMAKHNEYQYYLYDFSDDSVEEASEQSLYTIGLNTFMGEGAQVELSETFNKVSVEADEYTVDSDMIAPDLFKEGTLLPNAAKVGNKWIGNLGYHVDEISQDDKTVKYYSIPYKSLLWETYNYGRPNEQEFFECVDEEHFPKVSIMLNTNALNNTTGRTEAQYYYNYRSLFLTNDGVTPAIEGNIWSDETFNRHYQQLGATILREWELDLTHRYPAQSEWGKYLLFSCGLAGCIINSSNVVDVPVRTTKAQIDSINTWHKANNAVLAEYTLGPSATFGNAEADTFLTINANVFYSLFINYPTTQWKDKRYAEEYVSVEGQNELWEWPALQMQLEIGGKYYFNEGEFNELGFWHITNSGWTTNPNAKFYVPVNKDNNLVFNSWMNVTNSVSYQDNIEGSGFKITIPAGTTMTGPMNIRFFCPYLYSDGVESHFSWGGYLTALSVPRWVIMKDFSIKYYTPQGLWYDPDYEAKDTTYENVINEDYVEAGETISLKINTQNMEKPASWSSVLSGDTYLTELHSDSLNKSQKQEFNIIETWYNHYSKPCKRLDANQVNSGITPYSIFTYPTLSGSLKYLVDEQKIFLKENINEIKIVEI